MLLNPFFLLSVFQNLELIMEDNELMIIMLILHYLLCISLKYAIWYFPSLLPSIYYVFHSSTPSGTFPLSLSLFTMYFTQVHHVVLYLSPSLYLLCISRKYAI